MRLQHHGGIKGKGRAGIQPAPDGFRNVFVRLVGLIKVSRPEFQVESRISHHLLDRRIAL